MENVKKSKKRYQAGIQIAVVSGIIFSIISGISGIFSISQTAGILGVLLFIILLFCFRYIKLQQMEMEKREMEKQEQAREILIEWRHDFLNDLQMLLTLVQMEKYSRQMEYIKELTEKIHETGKILKISDVSLALFLLRQYQVLREKNVDLKIILESDLQGIPAHSRCWLFQEMFELVNAPQKESRECLLLISDNPEGVKIYFNFPGDRDLFDWKRMEALKGKVLQNRAKAEFSFEEEEATFQIIFPPGLETSRTA